MSSDRHDGWGRRTGRALFGASLAAVVSVVGCGIGLNGASVDPADPSIEAGVLLVSRDAGGVPDALKTAVAPPTADASSAAVDSAVRSMVSPLCSIAQPDGAVSCSPDEGSCLPYGSDGDGGSFDGGAGGGLDGGSSPFADAAAPGPVACRVMPVRGEAGMSAGAPMCGAAGKGTDDSPCGTSSDCAAKYECVVATAQAGGGSGPVDGASAIGVCRQYCCNNVCAGDFYCFQQTMIGGSVAVPVCLPSTTVDASAGVDGGTACELLMDDTCPQYGQTCQVVPQASGQAGLACVMPGPATAGQSCEYVTCAAGLSCIGGVFPNRTCAQLCDRSDDACPNGQTCTSNALLSNIDAEVGVCT